jgi:hypothetical protein
MFIKIVVILLLLIVAASLLTGRTSRSSPRPNGKQQTQLRTLMLRVALALLAIGAVLATLHLTIRG